MPLQDEELPPLVPLGNNSDLGLEGDFCLDWTVVWSQIYTDVDLASLMAADPENPSFWIAIQGLWEVHAKVADWVQEAVPQNEVEVIANAEALAEAFRSQIPLLTKESHQSVDGSGIEFHYPIVYTYFVDQCATWMGGDTSIDDLFNNMFDFGG